LSTDSEVFTVNFYRFCPGHYAVWWSFWSLIVRCRPLLHPAIAVDRLLGISVEFEGD